MQFEQRIAYLLVYFATKGYKVRCSKFLWFCNEKAPEYAFKGFIFGGSGEIRTRDQRIKYFSIINLYQVAESLRDRLVRPNK